MCKGTITKKMYFCPKTYGLDCRCVELQLVSLWVCVCEKTMLVDVCTLCIESVGVRVTLFIWSNKPWMLLYNTHTKASYSDSTLHFLCLPACYSWTGRTALWRGRVWCCCLTSALRPSLTSTSMMKQKRVRTCMHRATTASLLSAAPPSQVP